MPEEKEQYITPEEMRALEIGADSRGITVELLMENAGRGIANEIELALGPLIGRNVVVVCGKGNNGGDGFVTARYLAQKGASVTVILLAKPAEIKTDEARNNWVRLVEVKRLIMDSADELIKHGGVIKDAAIVVDAIFGTGITGDIRDPDATAIRIINESEGRKVSIDIPSGLDPATGEAKEPAVKADMTITLHRPKSGLKGNEKFVGKLVVVPIGLD